MGPSSPFPMTNPHNFFAFHVRAHCDNFDSDNSCWTARSAHQTLHRTYMLEILVQDYNSHTAPIHTSSTVCPTASSTLTSSSINFVSNFIMEEDHRILLPYSHFPTTSTAALKIWLQSSRFCSHIIAFFFENLFSMNSNNSQIYFFNNILHTGRHRSSFLKCSTSAKPSVTTNPFFGTSACCYIRKKRNVPILL